jgi:hypothetical protein
MSVVDRRLLRSTADPPVAGEPPGHVANGLVAKWPALRWRALWVTMRRASLIKLRQALRPAVYFRGVKGRLTARERADELVAVKAVELTHCGDVIFVIGHWAVGEGVQPAARFLVFGALKEGPEFVVNAVAGQESDPVEGWGVAVDVAPHLLGELSGCAQQQSGGVEVGHLELIPAEVAEARPERCDTL